MSRPVHGLLLPLLFAVCLMIPLKVSECSRPPPSPSSGDDHVHVGRPHHQRQRLLLDAEARTARPPTCRTDVVAGAAGAGAAPPSSASPTTPARGVGAVAASSRPRQTSDADDRALLARSTLARRFLAGADVDVDGTASATDGSRGVSCRSYNPHINCPPAASKP
jgi:hypothetical protein|uniref:Uncharacterized protein n=1 Tax=Zea mays TaxID=4577 RepID=A0A804M2X5_MAIZE